MSKTGSKIAIATICLMFLLFISYNYVVEDAAIHESSTLTQPPMSDSSASKATKPNLSVDKTLVESDVVDSPSPHSLYLIAKTIRRCRNTPKSQDELNLWLNNANQLNEPQAYINDMLIRYEDCSKIKTPHRNTIELLTTAASLGSDDALDELWQIGDLEFGQIVGLDQLNRQQQITQQLAFKHLKFDLAEHLAKKGNEKSLMRLILGYHHDDPNNGQPNFHKAFAYTEVALHTTDNNDFYNTVLTIQEKLRRMMTDAEVIQAIELANELRQ